MEARIPVGIYPFQAELLPIIKRFDQLQQKFNLKRVFSVTGSGLIGKDIAYACNLQNIGIEVEKFSVDDFDGIESLIIVNPLQNSDITDKDLILASKKAIQQGMDIILCCNRNDSIVKSASELRSTYPNFTFSFDADDSVQKNRGNAMHYKRLDIPVILVGSLVENPDTIETVCHLYESFSKIGVKCLVFNRSSVGGLFGFKSISSILNMSEFMESTKIELINQYANKLILQLTPELIILEAPDSVMRFSNITPNGFGILSYMISQAFQPDCFICSIPFELAVPNIIKALSKDFEIRLGTSISAIIATNIVVDSAENLQSHDMSFVFVPMAYTFPKVLQKTLDDDIPIYNTANYHDPGMFTHISKLLGIKTDGVVQ